MENIWVIIITSLISGILATILTIICQKEGEEKRVKREIFEMLMSHRYLICDKENVEALNKIEVVFYRHGDVVEAWKEFIKAADEASQNPAKNKTDDCYLKLLEKISKAVGYKKISWTDIKKYYYPQGLSSKIMEETVLRKAQIQQFKSISNQDHANPSQMTTEEMGMRVVMKALESPDGLTTITKLIEYGNKGGKKK